MNRLPFVRPKYLLDLERWQIRLFDDCWKNEEELKKNGYAAISYAWGKWKDRSTFALINDPRYPTFNIGQKDKPLFWRFPIVRAKPGEPAEQFTIDEARRTLTRMGMRFVWWDWTCIPQGFLEAKKPGDEDYVLHPDLVPIFEQEVNKMRYVYPFSKRGRIWAHSVRWHEDSALETALVACCAYSATQTGTYPFDR